MPEERGCFQCDEVNRISNYWYWYYKLTTNSQKKRLLKGIFAHIPLNGTVIGICIGIGLSIGAKEVFPMRQYEI